MRFFPVVKAVPVNINLSSADERKVEPSKHLVHSNLAGVCHVVCKVDVYTNITLVTLRLDKVWLNAPVG